MTKPNLFARFRRNEDGNLTVEAIILLPILLVMFAAMFVLFDYFKAHSIAGKTAYTVGDMVSRETNYITPAYVEGAFGLVRTMNGTERDDSGLRITVISYDADADRLDLEWSHATGQGLSPLTEGGVNAMRDRIPAMPAGLQMILVETTHAYQPAMNIGLGEPEIATFVTTVPRFAPQVPWQG